ncbi:MAG: hypothetical protein IJJ94_02675 [Bacteroidaceae bacterium]|nr:hypothetical protein [Bacteroidaceae bacterium]
MKKNIYIQSLSRAVMALAVVGAMTSCAEDAGLFDIFQGGDGTGLSVAPVVSEPTVVTRAESVEALNEKQLNTLDVFVEHVTSGTGDGTFMKQYHLVASASTPIQVAANNWLADNWRAEGLVVGEKYNIYVAANNTKTKANVADVAALKDLIYSEVEEGIAVVDEATNNIAWPWTEQFANTPSGFIYKQFVAEDDADAVKVSGSLYGFTTEKEFMMDDVLENWTPVTNSRDQIFQPVTLNRAAAKIVLNVKFDADFLKSLTQEKKTVDGVETWVDKPTEQQVKIQADGKPAWRFYNFAFGAPVFAPETQGAGVEVHNSATLLRHPYGFVGDDKNFQIITYTYPNMWAQADYATKAPSLVISVPYIEGTSTEPIFHYYRIPIVKSDVTKIERNHIYVVNATIATRGSDLHEDEDLIEDVVYNVLPWNDENNSAAIHNEVEAVQHMYLKVNPKVYTLRGDGDQSVIINYLKATGTEVGWKLFAINPSTEEKGEAVESTASDAVWGWFYDKNGKMKTTYSNWYHIGVVIAQSEEGTSGSKGTVTVTSTALYNRAIKYMLLRVYLKDNPSLYEDVIIRHFPTDNIQSITGYWSSYHTGTGGGTVREYSWDPVADGWAEGTYQSEVVDVEIEATPAEYLAGNAQRAEYSGQLDMNGNTGGWFGTDYRDYWTNAVPQASRQGANSEENSYKSSDGLYWWGTGSQNSRNYNNDYDWIQGTGNNRFYRYRYFYYARYTKTEQRTRYYREVEAPVGTGNWVDWERDAGQTGTAKYDSRGDDPNCENDSYHAHIFYNGTVHYLNSSYNNNASIGDSYGTSYNNNHMYVIQISSTSEKYVLGKPLVQNNVSNDQVVAPAFMIGSQLGIVTNTGWNSTRAADHCSKYMEVADDGTRYTGWRLPTADEIEVIVNYQQGRFGNITISQEDRVIAEVLKGANYYNLSGGSTATNISGATNGTFLRCIRELSAEEIEKLNGFDKLIAKYQAK